MKKHLFSLMMAFALVVGLSASAWAQPTGLPAAPVTGSFGNPKIYLTGATDSLQVEKGQTTSTLEWKLYKGSVANAAALVTDTDIDLDAHPTWVATQTNAATDPARFRFKWTDAAAGPYYLEVTETDQRAGRNCAQTVRGFHIYIMGFDVAIYASNADGDTIDLAARANCGGDTYPAFLNDVVMNVDGTIRGDIWNTSTEPATNGTDIKPIIGHSSTRPLRYYTAEIHFDAPPATTGTQDFKNPLVGSAKMDIAINLTEVNGQDSMYVDSINGVAMPGDKASVLQSVVIRNGDNNVANTVYKYTFPVRFNDSWGADLTPTATVKNVTLFAGTAGDGVNLGEEPAAYEDFTPNTAYRDNTSNDFTIYGKPATGEIKIHP